ncbi:MAG: Gfo/Idh/MocA family oxidoreductase, partial [Planctomycetes bacterium]|nr:Gfo/Idh/MocA family oxidoreductase [Planctomycetota bacterium]
MSKRIHRRDLLKSTAAAGVGYWMATSKVRAESPNEKLDIVCIGIGGRGGANVGGVSSQNIIGLCDVDERTGGGSFKRFPKAAKFQDFRKMLDKMEKQIDAVVVSTPDHTHFHPAIQAMQMGKHLYCEKPMAHSVWECRKMTLLAKKMKVATQLGVQRHTITNMHRVVE